MAFDSNIKGYMTFGKSFSRGAAFPLEAYEIWTDYDALVAYAANTDPNKDPSYIGQKVAYVDKANNKVTHYGIEIDGTLKELGAVPVGDGKSISVDANGAISLLGVENADSLTLPRMKEDKSGIEWVPVSAVVQGDGNDNTTYTFTPVTKGEGEDAETYGFIVKTFFNGTAVEGGEFTFGFDVYTKSEVDAAIKEVADLVGVPAEDDDSTDTLYERIAAEVLRATQAEGALSDRIGVAKNGDAAATGVYAYVDGVVNALVNGVDADKIDSLNELIAWVEAHPAIVEELDGRLDKVEDILDGIGDTEAGEKATVKAYVDDAFTAHRNAADGKYATKQEIADAGYAVAADIERDYAKKATTLEGYGITDAYTKNQIDEKIGTPGVPAVKDSDGNVTTDAIPGTGVFANTYSKAELNTLLDEIEGGSTESAASVARQLDEYKTSNNERVKNIEDKVGKDVNGEEPATGLFLEVDQARAVADEAKTASTKNANDIAAIQGQLGTTDGNVSGILQRLGALETEVGVEEKSRIDVLEGVLNGVDETEGLVAIVTGHGTKIGLLEAADIRIEKKADDNATAILALQNKVDTGDKTVKTYVDDAVKAVADIIDFTPYAKKDEVAATYATIAALEGIYKAGEGEVEATGVLAEEIARAKAAEKKLGDDLAILINNPTEDLDSVFEIIEHVKNNGTAVTGIIGRLDDHDTILAGIGGEGQPATVVAAIEAAKYVISAATIDTLGGLKSAADVDGKVAVNKVYVDEDGKAEVKAFSTDNLVQGSMILILNGGDAQVVTNA